MAGTHGLVWGQVGGVRGSHHPGCHSNNPPSTGPAAALCRLVPPSTAWCVTSTATSPVEYWPSSSTDGLASKSPSDSSGLQDRQGKGGSEGARRGQARRSVLVPNRQAGVGAHKLACNPQRDAEPCGPQAAPAPEKMSKLIHFLQRADLDSGNIGVDAGVGGWVGQGAGWSWQGAGWSWTCGGSAEP